MTVLLICFGAISLLELMLWLPPVWRLRRAIICLTVPAVALLSGLIFGRHFELWAGLLLLFTIYRIINLLRVLENRLQVEQLYFVSRRTSYWLLLSQATVLGSVGIIHGLTVKTLFLWYVLAVLQLAAALVLFTSTRRHLRTTRPPEQQPAYSDRDLPTLSVLIPARNETEDLEACLQSLVRNNYPKLEIIVLDDCSQNKRTPGIIRDFAQSGVRFIAGQAPPKHWLAKNYAYRQLAEEANGEILLFCGVDTRFGTDTLRAMVVSMLAKKKRMASFIPANQVPQWWNLEASAVQPARYAWELSPPRRLFNRPPVLSTCWLIEQKMLDAAGGFDAVSRSISPESYFARYAIRHHDSYSFLRSDSSIGLTSAKSFSEQRATAVRTRYPQLHRRPELVAWSLIGEVMVLTLPFVMLIISLLVREWYLAGLSALVCVLLVGFYARVVSLTYRRFLYRGVWTLPFVALYDIGLLNISMWRYEFREIIWKGRNVCVPVMQTPQINNTVISGSERKH